MKQLLSAAIAVLFMLTSFSLQAQFKQIAAGPSFEEPPSGFPRLLLMKNGSVMFIRVAPKESIDIRIYNAAHKEIAVTSFEPSYGKLKAGQLQSVFEINGDAVIMVSEVDGKVPVLYRIIVDGTTGKMKKEEKIAELKKLTLGMGYAMAWGSVDMPDFYISKDPESDNYAVALFNTFESDRNKRIEIVLYGSDHKELSRAYYASPDEKYKYLEYISMTVMGSDRVSVLVNGYNNKKDREVILASLEKGATEMKFHELGFPQDSVLESGMVRYNPHIKKLVVVAKMHERKSSKDAELCVAIIDPVKGKMEKRVNSGLSEEVYERAKEIFGKKYKYWGVPVNLYINNDGGFSVVYEESAIITNTSMNSGRSSSHVETYNIVVSTYDKTAKLLKCYMIPKNYWIDNPSSLSYAGGFGNQYKKFAYVNGADKSYILINDTRRNIEKQEKNKEPIQIQGVGDCDAFYFPLSGSDPIPQRKYLFGESDDKKERNLAPFGVSVYDKANDVFIVLRLNKDGRDKSVNLIWLKP